MVEAKHVLLATKFLFFQIAPHLLPRGEMKIFENSETLRKYGGRYRTRTYDPLIKSQLLYQLS